MAPSDPRLAAVVLAGGAGTRLGLPGGRNKVYVPIGGLPMLAWSLRTLDGVVVPRGLVVVVRSGDESEAAVAIDSAELERRPEVVAGGETRTGSEAAGIAALRQVVDEEDVEVVLLHDGARPFASRGLIRRLAVAARTHGVAVPGLSPPVGTVEVGPDGAVTLADRDHLRRVQTPQAVRTKDLLDAFDLAAQRGVEGVDTAEVVTRCGGPSGVVVPGEEDNVKVTTPEDLTLAAEIATRRGAGA